MLGNSPTLKKQNPTRGYSYLWSGLSLMATIVVAGVIITESAQNFINDNARQAFLARTKIAVTGIDASLVTSLAGQEDDTTLDAYASLKKQLIAVKDASDDMRFVYLMGKRNNDVIFLVDAEPTDSEDYSAPGEIYPEPSTELLGIFENGQAFVEGPIVDSWGTWISGHAPIREPGTDRILAIIGIDIDASTWKQTVNLYHWGSLGIMLLLLALVLVYFLSLWRISHVNAKRRLAAHQLELAIDELQQANKELESFSYSVSHDLRAPLRHIQGYSEALDEEYSDNLDKEGLGYLQRLRQAAASMDRLILGLLKLSRVSKQDLNIIRVNLSALAEDIIQELNKEYTDKNYQTMVTPELVCFGDSRLLRLVLENLISNAYKYASHTAQPRVEFGATDINGQTTYFVKDNGVGFDMAFKEKLFEPFQRLHHTDEFEGSGIGLSTVARIIRRHKGRIWAEGKPNGGAVFYFTLGLII